MAGLREMQSGLDLADNLRSDPDDWRQAITGQRDQVVTLTCPVGCSRYSSALQATTAI
jgi:hypothetical protein